MSGGRRERPQDTLGDGEGDLFLVVGLLEQGGFFRMGEEAHFDDDPVEPGLLQEKILARGGLLRLRLDLIQLLLDTQGEIFPHWIPVIIKSDHAAACGRGRPIAMNTH